MNPRAEIFIASSRAFLSETGIFSGKVKNMTAACAMALISAKAPKVFQALVLHH